MKLLVILFLIKLYARKNIFNPILMESSNLYRFLSFTASKKAINFFYRNRVHLKGDQILAHFFLTHFFHWSLSLAILSSDSRGRSRSLRIWSFQRLGGLLRGPFPEKSSL